MYITKAHYLHIVMFYGHNYLRTNSYVYILFYQVSKHLICIQAKVNHSLKIWTKNPVRDYSLHVPRGTISFVIYLTHHLCILCAMAVQLLGLFMLFPYQEVKHQTIVCYYFLGCMWTTNPGGCNYRYSMFCLIGITMKKRIRGKNISDYKD